MPEITKKAALLLCQDLKGRLNIVINSVYIFDCLTHLMHEGESAGLAGYPNGTLEETVGKMQAFFRQVSRRRGKAAHPARETCMHD